MVCTPHLKKIGENLYGEEALFTDVRVCVLTCLAMTREMGIGAGWHEGGWSNDKVEKVVVKSIS